MRMCEMVRCKCCADARFNGMLYVVRASLLRDCNGDVLLEVVRRYILCVS